MSKDGGSQQPKQGEEGSPEFARLFRMRFYVKIFWKTLAPLEEEAQIFLVTKSLWYGASSAAHQLLRRRPATGKSKNHIGTS